MTEPDNPPPDFSVIHRPLLDVDRKRVMEYLASGRKADAMLRQVGCGFVIIPFEI